MDEVERYFIEYLSIKYHFLKDTFWYDKSKVNIRNIQKYQYNTILKYAKTMTIKTFRKYLMVNFFFNSKFNIYSKKVYPGVMNIYYIYYGNVKYNYEKDIKYIKESCVKIDYEILYNMYIEGKIYYYTIINIYKKYKDKLKMNEQNKLKLEKYIYLEQKFKEKNKT